MFGLHLHQPVGNFDHVFQQHFTDVYLPLLDTLEEAEILPAVLHLSGPLLDWLDEAGLDRVGCFRYEPVEGATANDVAEPVPDKIKDERWHRFMQRQQAISARRLKRKVGTRQQVIIDETGPSVAKGRSMADAPEIDTSVFVKAPRVRPGQFIRARAIAAAGYDLEAEAIGGPW